MRGDTAAVKNSSSVAGNRADLDRSANRSAPSTDCCTIQNAERRLRVAIPVREMARNRRREAAEIVERTAEGRRLAEARLGAPWRRWGPYVSDRQWGTVREDYCDDGNTWDYFPHDHARSRAYRWGEDGIAGFGDEHLYLCLGLALWNERDPILKERLFGLTNAEGNHGEDVKEIYHHLDA